MSISKTVQSILYEKWIEILHDPNRLREWSLEKDLVFVSR